MPEHLTREVVLHVRYVDFGLSVGSRIVEIGCVELINHLRTERTFHAHVRPECAFSEGGDLAVFMDNSTFSEMPTFADIAMDLMAFISDSQVVMASHNSAIYAINDELERINAKKISFNITIDLEQFFRRCIAYEEGIDDAINILSISAGNEKNSSVSCANDIAVIYIDILNEYSAFDES